MKESIRISKTLQVRNEVAKIMYLLRSIVTILYKSTCITMESLFLYLPDTDMIVVIKHLS